MPSLLPRSGRRKRITPLVNFPENDVWERTFKVLGLEPLERFEFRATELAKSKMAETTMKEPKRHGPGAEGGIQMAFMDLPMETQREVMKYVSVSIRWRVSGGKARLTMRLHL